MAQGRNAIKVEKQRREAAKENGPMLKQAFRPRNPVEAVIKAVLRPSTDPHTFELNEAEWGRIKSRSFPAARRSDGYLEMLRLALIRPLYPSCAKMSTLLLWRVLRK